MIFSALLFWSVAAHAADFSNFKGSYTPTSAPQVTMLYTTSCNWQGVRNISKLKISKENGSYFADLESQAGGETTHTITKFQEFSFQGEWGVRLSAVVSGDANSATYSVASTRTESEDLHLWAIEKTEAGYRLRLSHETAHITSPVVSCYYVVDLKKSL